MRAERAYGSPTPARLPRGGGRAALVAAAALMIAVALTPAVHILTAPVVEIRLAGRAVRATVADTAWRRTWGLQGRPSLEDGTGMLFTFDSPDTVRFSRKSLSFPVDVVFVSAERRVTGIATLDADRPTATSPGTAQWVVEVPGGWASRTGVRAGSLVEIPAVP